MLPRLLNPSGIAGLQAMVEAELEESWTANHPGRQRPSRRRFHNNGFLWPHYEQVRCFCLESRLPKLAAAILGVESLRLLMDEVFVKEPQTDVTVPWHNDASYWPVGGAKMGSFWFALDDVTVDNGAVMFRGGSHLASELHEPTSFLAPTGGPLRSTEAATRTLSWTLSTGDALFFDAFTEHSSTGNASGSRRRAYSVRYGSTDVRYEPRTGTSAMMQVPGLREGELLPDDIFPRAV